MVLSDRIPNKFNRFLTWSKNVHPKSKYRLAVLQRYVHKESYLNIFRSNICALQVHLSLPKSIILMNSLFDAFDHVMDSLHDGDWKNFCDFEAFIDWQTSLSNIILLAAGRRQMPSAEPSKTFATTANSTPTASWRQSSTSTKQFWYNVNNTNYAAPLLLYENW